MNAPAAQPRITLRIPGTWSHPKELLERMPQGYLLRSDVLLAPDGTEFEFTPIQPDGEFPRVFRSACRRTATDEELAAIDH